MQKPKKLPSKSQIRAELDAKVLNFMRGAPGMRRVTDVSKALNVPVSAANVSLRRLLSGGDLVRSSAPKLGRDGHKHGEVPLYKSLPVVTMPNGPAWMSPTVPKFSNDSIVGKRVYAFGRLVKGDGSATEN